MRATQHLTQAQIAKRAGYTRTYVTLVESGTIVPGREVVARLDDALSAGGALLALRSEAESKRWAVQPIAAPLSDPFEQPGTERPALQFEPLAVVLGRVESLSASAAGGGWVRGLELAIEDVVDRYEAEGPQRLSGEVVGLRRLVEDLRRDAPNKATGSQILGLAGRLSGLLGYMAVNSGRFALADLYCREAFDLAMVAGDPDLQAWARGTQSLAAYYRGRFQEALDCARDGQRYARGGPQSIRLAVNGEARALGRLGDRAGVDRAVGFAFEGLTKISSPAGMTPCISFGPYSQARVMANAATAYLGVGAPARVMGYGEELERLVDESDSVWSQSLVRLDVATAHLRERSADVEQAMRTGIMALQASADRPIRSVWQRAHELRSEAIRWKHDPAVQDYCEALRLWESQPRVRAVASAP